MNEIKHDIGIVCMFGQNYGNQLTYFALYKYVTSLGYSALLIDFPDDCNMARNMPIEHQDKFKNWIKTPYPEKDVLVHLPQKGSLSGQNWLCDMFLLGSDQLLRAGFVWDMGFHQCMDWVYSNKYKIAYSASFGTDIYEGDDRIRAREGFFLNRFQKISVREESGIDILKTEFGIDSTLVLDPVFLCDKNEYAGMAESAKNRLPNEKYSAAYILDPTEERAKMVQHIADSFSSGTAIAISDACRFQDDGYSWNFPTLEDVKIEEWISAIYNSDFFITDSFHGVCFALIFRKQFVVVFSKEQWRGLARITSILKMFGLEDRLVESLEELKNRDLFSNQINYEKVGNLIEQKITESASWLKGALEARKNFKINDTPYDLLLDAKFEVYQNIDSRINEVTKDFRNNLSCLQEKSSEQVSKLCEQISVLQKQNKISALQKQNEMLLLQSKQIDVLENRLSKTYNLLINTRHRTFYGACAWLFHKIFKRK